MYSYRNLIEIAIISELFQYGIPFMLATYVMKSEELKDILKREAWDTIFWITREDFWGSRYNLPVIGLGFTGIDNFLRKGGEILIAPKGISYMDETSGVPVEKTSEPVIFKSSAIVINISTLKKHVDYMVGKL